MPIMYSESEKEGCQNMHQMQYHRIPNTRPLHCHVRQAAFCCPPFTPVQRGVEANGSGSDAPSFASGHPLHSLFQLLALHNLHQFLLIHLVEIRTR